MRKFLGVKPAYGRARTRGRAAAILTLAALLLAFLMTRAIRAAGAARDGHLASGAQAAGLTKSLFATAATAVLATEAMLVSFALALAAGMLLLVAAELLWRFSRRPDSRP